MEKEYKAVLQKYADAELDKLTEEEYRELKEAEMADMQSYVNAITDSNVPEVMYRIGRAVPDLKYLLESSADIWGSKVLYHQIMQGDKEFTEFTYDEVRRDVRGLGTSLFGLGLKGAHIGIIGANCYEWAESYWAVTGGTGVVVPLDKELSPGELETLCNMGDLRAVICCQEKYYKIFKEIKAAGNTGLEFVIAVGHESHEDEAGGLYSWNKLRADGIARVEAGDRSFVDARVRASDMVSILFTSGTTGVSKGVMLSHRNLCTDILIAQTYLEVCPEDIFFSVLPIHHTYECTCTMLEGCFMGASMAFCRGLKYITKDMQAVRPTFLLAVPLIYEKFYNTIQKTLKKQGQDKLVNTLFAINNVTSRIGINVAKPIARKIMAQFGGRIDMFIAGGARVDPKVLAFFRSMGIPCLQGYGLTETSSGVAISVCGDPYALEVCPEDEVTLAPDGEILVRSPACMMLGYYNRPEETDEVLREGTLFTGDLGRWDEDGKLHIIGRKKEILVLKDGTKIFLPEYEARIMRVLPGRDFAVLERDGKPVLLLHGKEEERAELQDKLREVMSELPRGQQISGFTFRDSPLPRTATGKIQRWELTGKQPQ